MKLFEDLPSTDMPINAENLNQIQDNLVVVSTTEPTGDNREKVWMQKGNLYNSANNVSGYYLDSSGVETANSAWSLTEYIPIKPNENYKISGVTVAGTAPYCAYYDSNKNFISSFKNSNGAMMTLSNAYYIRFSINGADIIGFKFELCPKIYVKNDNDVYEEFISKEDTSEVYSTEETRIGTWIDGRLLYRKVIEGTTSSTEETTTIDLGRKIIPRNFYGDIYEENRKLFVPLNYANPDVTVYTYILNSGTNTEIKIVVPDIFKNCSFMLVVEYVV